MAKCCCQIPSFLLWPFYYYFFFFLSSMGCHRRRHFSPRPHHSTASSLFSQGQVWVAPWLLLFKYFCNCIPDCPENQHSLKMREGGWAGQGAADSPAPCPCARLRLALTLRLTERCLVEPQKPGRELTGRELVQRHDMVWESWRCSGGTSERKAERRAEASGREPARGRRCFSNPVLTLASRINFLY